MPCVAAAPGYCIDLNCCKCVLVGWAGMDVRRLKVSLKVKSVLKAR